jgi:hypothetical protein
MTCGEDDALLLRMLREGHEGRGCLQFAAAAHDKSGTQVSSATSGQAAHRPLLRISDWASFDGDVGLGII